MNNRFRDNCFYCEHNQTMHERMIPIITFDATTVYLNRDQTHPGRVIVALNWHVDEIFELTSEQRFEFIQEVSFTAKTIKKHYNASKINFGIYGDTVSHLHVHSVTKLPTNDDWDDAFVNNPSNPQYLDDDEYQKIRVILRKELEKAYETIKN